MGWRVGGGGGGGDTQVLVYKNVYKKLILSLSTLNLDQTRSFDQANEHDHLDDTD